MSEAQLEKSYAMVMYTTSYGPMKIKPVFWKSLQSQDIAC